MERQLDTLAHMDTRLRTRMLCAMIARWRAGERAIASCDLYHQLLASGEAIPAGSMAAVFDNLRALKLIAARLPENTIALGRHGDTSVTWLHPSLLAESPAIPEPEP